MNLRALRQVWQQRSARERSLLALALGVLVLAALWQWAFWPALATWRGAAERQSELDRQTRQMLQLQAEARQLKAPARLSRTQAVQALERSAAELLGPDAQLLLQGDQLRVTLTAAPAPALARWLSLAREQAQALPQAAQLQQTSPTPPPAGGKTPDVLWRGQLTLRLP